MESRQKFQALLDEATSEGTVTIADHTVPISTELRMAFKLIYGKLVAAIQESDAVVFDHLLEETAGWFLTLRSDDAPSLEIRPVVDLVAE